jgi:predicted ATPase
MGMNDLKKILEEQRFEERMKKLMEHAISDDEAARIEELNRRVEAEENARYEAENGTPDVRRLVRAGFGRREAEAVCHGNLKGDGWHAKLKRVLEIMDGKGIAVLAGDCGTGKTVMAAAIGKVWQERKRDVRYVRAADFFCGLKATWAKQSEVGEKDYLEEFREVSLLIVDEIQDRSAGDWENMILNTLIDHRYADMMPVLILTNKVGNDAVATLPRSVASRVEGTGSFVSLDWGSYRKGGAR